jgi:hypothetical protein
MTRREQVELYALICQAWELRGTPYLRDACQAIVDWNERRPLTALEHYQSAQAEERAA